MNQDYATPSAPLEPFGKWRVRLWPIHRAESKKFLLMAFIFFLISFNYNVLRSCKDTIIVTARNSGAEAIPFIKVWVVLPMAILFTLLYTRLANRFSREKVFYIIISIFLSFFFIFAFFLYPAREFFHPNALADQLQLLLPPGYHGLISTFRNWTFTLFYVVSELWSTMIFTVLFWGFANEITQVSQAKRFYGLLMTAGNVAGIFSGKIAIFFSSNLFIPWIPYGNNTWDQSIFFFTCTVLCSGLLTVILFRWLNIHISKTEATVVFHQEKPKKVKLSMRENFAHLVSSKYLICIALIVLGYNVAINLVEVVWKSQMQQLFPDPCAYNTYMGKVTMLMSVTATLAGFLTASNIIRRCSWTIGALLPPLIIGITGILFFTIVFMQHWNYLLGSMILGTSPLVLSVTVGSLQNCLSRATKYTFFDATKEIAFIPMDNESKLKGKAAIDGIGSRIGKSGGSVIHQFFIILFSTVAASSHCIALVFLGIVFFWILAVISLGKQFDQLISKQATLETTYTQTT